MRRLFLALCLALAAAVPLHGNLVVPADLPTLVKEARLIVVGRVVDVRAEWIAAERRVETFVTLDVDDALKGVPAGHLIFRVPGGQYGRYRTVMVGAPEFRAGDEAVLFFGSAPAAYPYPLGLSQGVFRVRQDRLTGERMVLPPPTLLDPNKTLVVRRGGLERRMVPVDTFAGMVRDLVKAARP